MKTGCVVVAAGRGKRAGLTYNKVFYPLAGRSVLSRTLDALSYSGEIDDIVLVLNRDDFDLYKETVLHEGENALIRAIVPGGETRRDSVFSGLKALPQDTDIVLVHDAARPFVTREIIREVIRDAQIYGSGVISTAVTDTVKRVGEDGAAIETLDRSALRTVQTPQGFDYQKLLHAHRTHPADAGATDDAYLYEKVWGSVHLTNAQGASRNCKLTTPEDFIMAEERLTPRFRTGTGYDVHRLVPGRKLILCGVEVPYEKGLLGHSDADVAVHALMDALLGAAALGDIGKLFPDKDPAYENISSLLLLKLVMEKLRLAGYQAENCDITVVCQAPKLAPYIDEMRRTLAETMELPFDAVSVKATTTERLGFEGEGLGISAQSAVLIRRNQ
ncbi:MAG: 2-C-methyl-D-erythritol 2,4-cyclodiphosphate synthase [Clostridia bacterium]|nr:2-C-methyl-D-erythritol 2,4-cyclodiphosphate synthase [Clostridia bacterium]